MSWNEKFYTIEKTNCESNTNIRVPFPCKKKLALVVWMLPWNKILFLPDLGHLGSSAVNCFDNFAAKTIDDSFVPQIWAILYPILKLAATNFIPEFLRCPYPPYSPDIAPSDYHLFRSMTHGLSEKCFTSYEDTKKWVDSWIAAKGESLFRRGIRMLPERWEKVVASEGKYFEWSTGNLFFKIKP